MDFMNRREFVKTIGLVGATVGFLARDLFKPIKSDLLDDLVKDHLPWEPGMLVMVMGGPGTGKTMLIDALKKRCPFPVKVKLTDLTDSCPPEDFWKAPYSYSTWIWPHNEMVTFVEMPTRIKLKRCSQEPAGPINQFGGHSLVHRCHVVFLVERVVRASCVRITVMKTRYPCKGDKFWVNWRSLV